MFPFFFAVCPDGFYQFFVLGKSKRFMETPGSSVSLRPLIERKSCFVSLPLVISQTHCSFFKRLRSNSPRANQIITQLLAIGKGLSRSTAFLPQGGSELNAWLNKIAGQVAVSAGVSQEDTLAALSLPLEYATSKYKIK